jgi:hypothetical protein
MGGKPPEQHTQLSFLSDAVGTHPDRQFFKSFSHDARGTSILDHQKCGRAFNRTNIDTIKNTPSKNDRTNDTTAESAPIDLPENDTTKFDMSPASLSGDHFS